MPRFSHRTLTASTTVIATTVALAAFALASSHLPPGRAARRVAAVAAVDVAAPRAIAPAQVATATPDPRPNLVAVRGEWKLEGRNISTWNRCVSGSGYEQGFHLCVENAGNAPSGPFVVVADNALALTLLSTGGLQPAETLCAPVDVAPGVGLVVDPGDDVAESDEGDNWLPAVPVPTLEPIAHPTCEPRPTPLAELSGSGAGGFVDLGGYPCWPSPGTRFIYTAHVANDGEVAAGPFRVGPPDWPIPDLPADASRTTNDPNVVPDFSSQIDADNVVTEHDETNNTLYVLHGTAPAQCPPGPTSTPFPAPDVVIERAEYRHMGFDDVCVPEVVAPRVFVRVANVGTGPAGAFAVVADSVASPRDVAGLDPGAHVDVDPFDAPVHNVRIVDHDPYHNGVAGDGRRIAQVTLTPPPTCTPVSTPTPATPTPPDLVPTFTFSSFPRCEADDGAVVGRLSYQPCVANHGGAEARGFVVRIGEGARAEDIAIPQLDGGGTLCLAERDDFPSAIEVDPDNRVAESDETNNRVNVYPPPQARPPRCTPGPTPTATPTPAPLPNLRGWARWWVDLPDGCIPTDRPMPPFFSALTVANNGAAPAASFDAVGEPPRDRRWAFAALPAGATYTRGPGPFDFTHVVIDPDNRVAESDETDNDVEVPPPTLPPYCPTKTATRTDATVPPSTPTPTPTVPPTPARRWRLLVPVAWRLSTG
ncbi:MAG: hypothetical protein ABI780_07980 [Ardenticatenales bacterium]